MRKSESFTNHHIRTTINSISSSSSPPSPTSARTVPGPTVSKNICAWGLGFGFTGYIALLPPRAASQFRRRLRPSRLSSTCYAKQEPRHNPTRSTRTSSPSLRPVPHRHQRRPHVPLQDPHTSEGYQHFFYSLDVIISPLSIRTETRKIPFQT